MHIYFNLNEAIPNWAEIAQVVISIFSLFIGGFGLYYLYRNFETQKAINQKNDNKDRLSVMPIFVLKHDSQNFGSRGATHFYITLVLKRNLALKVESTEYQWTQYSESEDTGQERLLKRDSIRNPLVDINDEIHFTINGLGTDDVKYELMTLTFLDIEGRKYEQKVYHIGFSFANITTPEFLE